MTAANTLGHLRPAAGRRVRRADGTVLPDEGEELPITTYYRRLLADGDLEPVPTARASEKRKSA